MTAILLITFFVLVFLTVPIAFALLAAAMATLAAMSGINDIPLALIPSSLYAATANFSLLAIPFFVLAGNIMVVGGIAKRLVDFFNALIGGVAGGLAHAATLACMFFAALSGSSAATAASIGKALIPEMERHRYDKKFSGMIIPPSIAMIGYAMTAEGSVTQRFSGGVIPGLLGGLAIMAYSFFFARKHNYTLTEEELKRRPGLFRAFLNAFWAITMPVVILGGIYGGIFTATEASAIAVLYGVLVSLIYREITIRSFIEAVIDAVYDTATILLIMGSSAILGWVLVVLQLPQSLAAAMLGFSSNPYVILLLILVLYLIIGCFIGTSPAIVLVVPILLPAIKAVGIDLVFFGVFTVFALGIGLITPPVGTDLFVVSSIARLKFEDVVRAVVPLIVIYTLLCVLFIFVPQLITFLPDLVTVQ